jgi:hypothetical protein
MLRFDGAPGHGVKSTAAEHGSAPHGERSASHGDKGCCILGEIREFKMESCRRSTMLKRALTLTGLSLGAGLLLAADFPQAQIRNGQIRATLTLPDAHKGYYRGSRFDWSGVILSLEYKGHNYYGPWFDKTDPKVHDFVYDAAGGIVAGPCSAITGPAEEFLTNNRALGYDEAKAGGTFIKIGVGVLRKPDAGNYDRFKLYEIVDPGKWTVKKKPDSIQFTQAVTDPSSGYAYTYRKTVRLTKGKPEMVLEHSLKNTGSHTIRSSTYNHNFLVLDKQPTSPDFVITLPFQMKVSAPPSKDLAEIRGNQIRYLKVLQGQDRAAATVQGFGNEPKDYDVRIDNAKLGVGMRITGDRPLSSQVLWSIRSVLAMEPFIDMTIEPGNEFTWKISYEYYTLPAKGQ